MLSGNIDLGDIKKKKKTAISITVDKENLESLKEDMKKYGLGDGSVSAVFDAFLKSIVENIKKKKESEKKEGENDK